MGSRDDLKERPLPVALLPNHLCQLTTTFGPVRTVPTQAARRQKDYAEALGVVVHLPIATAANHENPDPGVQMSASNSQTP